MGHYQERHRVSFSLEIGLVSFLLVWFEVLVMLWFLLNVGVAVWNGGDMFDEVGRACSSFPMIWFVVTQSCPVLVMKVLLD